MEEPDPEDADDKNLPSFSHLNSERILKQGVKQVKKKTLEPEKPVGLILGEGLDDSMQPLHKLDQADNLYDIEEQKEGGGIDAKQSGEKDAKQSGENSPERLREEFENYHMNAITTKKQK